MSSSDCTYHAKDKVPKTFGLCPFSVAAFLASAALVTYQRRSKGTSTTARSSLGSASALPTCQVVFILGGPGAGKGTQCQLLTQRLKGNWVHLSAGDLLRAARKEGNHPLGDTINECISQGKLVPSEVTCQLLEMAMEEAYTSSKTTKFLIDGFPRSNENATVWQTTMSRHSIEFVLLLECPEEVLTGRLLERGQTSGRADDNIDVIRKRFATYREDTKPILAYYEKQGKVKKITADQPVEQVYMQVNALFANL